jgi:hypothetical protein
VEVQKNAYADEEHPRMTSVFKGEGEIVHKTTRAHLDRLHELGKQALGDAYAACSTRPSGSRSSTADNAAAPKPARSGPPSPEDEDEAGWQSDRSSGEPSTSQLITSGDRSSGSPKPHAKKKHMIPLHGRTRRRNSVRRSPAAPTVVVPAAAAAAREEEEDEGRGRRRNDLGPGVSRSTLPRKGPTSHLDRVRSIESRSRGVSPARSIRWADDEATSPRESVLSPRESITGTPRHSVPTSPSSPADDADGARHVVFDLPSGPRAQH